MDLKKIRKSGTLIGVLITILLVIGIFTGMSMFYTYNIQTASISNAPNYSYTNSSLYNAQDRLSQNVYEIKYGIGNITEADSGFMVAINGFRSLGAILKLPLVFADVIKQVIDAMMGTTQDLGIPAWIIALAVIGIIGFIVLLLLSILKGEQQKMI